jgi:LAO/AO transport system kinase
VVGITGSPGAGKSTLVDRLIGLYRASGNPVGVVAVDPASPFTGGAILGDRIRMQDHVGDPGVFVRSMSSRGHLGGLADATARVVALLDAGGFDPILVETVGVGQSEIEVVETADTSIVVVTPGWGDGVQAAKAGILEIGDLFVVNKSDLGGADQVVRDLTQMLELSPHDDWLPPVVTCSAGTGSGIETMGEQIDEHRRHLASGAGGVRRRRQIETTIRRAVTARLAADIHSRPIPADVIDAVIARNTDPWSVARSMA